MMKAVLLAACLLTPLALSAQAKPAGGEWLRCTDFQRDADGSWTARRDALVELPGGNATIHSSTVFPAAGTYMGVQFGFLLDEQCGRALHR
jgi:hypothetical protein